MANKNENEMEKKPKKERVYYSEAQYGYYKKYMATKGKEKYDYYKFALNKEKDGSLEEWKNFAQENGYKAFSDFVKDSMKRNRDYLIKKRNEQSETD